MVYLILVRIHSDSKIQYLKKLRKKGYSIESLVKLLGMPKTTVWHHIHSIKLHRKYIEKLRLNQGGSKLRMERDMARAQIEARSLLEGEHGMAYATICSLYWAEGSKGRCEFVNTDGEMIKLYLKIIRTHLRVPEDKIEPVLRIFSNHDPEESLNFWSRTTNIHKSKFKVLFNDGGTSGRTPFGMCRIVVLKGGYVLKLFKALSVELCKQIKPR